jgi:type IV pilus assembly protein PilM
VQDVNIGFQIIGDVMDNGAQKMETLLVAAKKEIIQNKIDIIIEAGLIPVTIDIDSFAVENAIAINLSEDELKKTFMVVNCGALTTNISIIENGKSRVVRDVFSAGDTFTKSLQRNLQVNWKQAEEHKMKADVSGAPAAVDTDPDKTKVNNGAFQSQISSLVITSVKELVSAIQRSIDYYQTQSTSENHVEKVYLCGGGMMIKGIDKYMQAQLHLPVELFNPFAGISRDAALLSDTGISFSQYAVAVGLATRKKGDVG